MLSTLLHNSLFLTERLLIEAGLLRCTIDGRYRIPNMLTLDSNGRVHRRTVQFVAIGMQLGAILHQCCYVLNTKADLYFWVLTRKLTLIAG